MVVKIMKLQQLITAHTFILIAGLLANLPSEAAIAWSPPNAASYANLLVGGVEKGQALGVCRVELNGGIHIGKWMPNKQCNVGWGGGEESLPAQSVLRNSERLEWRAYDARYQHQYGWLQNGGFEAPSTATANSLSSQQEQYVCRAAYKGGVHVGKLLANTHECLIGWGGEEVHNKNFDVLLEKTAPAYTASLPPLEIKPTQGRVGEELTKNLQPHPLPSGVCLNGEPKIQTISPTFSESTEVALTGACLMGAKKGGKLVFHFKGASAPSGGYSFNQSQAVAWSDTTVKIKMIPFIANEKDGVIAIDLITGEGKTAHTQSQFVSVKNKSK